MTLSVIVVSYNVQDFLRQTLRTLHAALGGIESEIIVVDNASSDGSAAMVRNEFPGVQLIASDENLGFARANNRGIEVARGAYLALVNPDTLIRNDTFSVCLEYLSGHADVGMVGCKILNPDGSLQLACRRSFPTPSVALSKILGLSTLFPRSQKFGRYNLTYLDPDQAADVEAISGSFMVMRRTVAAAVGGLDERFFMYGEDLDFCYRIHQAGHRIVYLPQTEIIHYKGQSATQAGYRSLMHFYQAMQLFVEKHFQRGWLWFPRWMMIAGIGLRGGLSFIARVLRPWIKPGGDIIALQAALAVALWLRFGHLLHYGSYFPVNVLYTLLWLIMFFVAGRYNDRRETLQRLFAGIGLGLLINTSLTFFLPQYAFSRQVLITMAALGGLFIVLCDYFIALARKEHKRPVRVLLIGTEPSLQEFVRQCHARQQTSYRIVGYIQDSPSDISPNAVLAYDVLGEIRDVKRILLLHRIEQIIFPFENGRSWPILMAYQWRQYCSVIFKMTQPAEGAFFSQDKVDAFRSMPLQVLSFRIDEPLYKLSKRMLDLVICILSIIPATLMRLFQDSGDSSLAQRWMAHWLPVFKGRKTWVGVTGRSAETLPRISGCISPQDLFEPVGCPEDDLPVLSFYLSQYTPWLDLQIIGQVWRKSWRTKRE